MTTKRTAPNLRTLRNQLRTATDTLRECMRLADGVVAGSEQTKIFAAWEEMERLEARVHRALGELEGDDPVLDAFFATGPDEPHLGAVLAGALAGK